MALQETGARIGSCVGGMECARSAARSNRARNRGRHARAPARSHHPRRARISHLRAVVLDEADEMLDLGFREDLEFILAAAPDDRRTLLFSATVPKPIAQLAKRFQRDALRISATGESDQHADIEYSMILVAPPSAKTPSSIRCSTSMREHAGLLLHPRSGQTPVLPARQSRLRRRLAVGRTQPGRAHQRAAVDARGRARVCVATDVAARGIDLPNLDSSSMPTCRPIPKRCCTAAAAPAAPAARASAP